MTTAVEMLALYIAAEKAVLIGQSFEIAGRKLSRADLVEIRAGRREWEAAALRETRAASGTSRVAYANFGGS